MGKLKNIAPIMSRAVVDLIREETHTRGWDAERFSRAILGSERLAQSVLNGEARMTQVMLFRLANAFGTSIALWRNLQEDQKHV